MVISCLPVSAAILAFLTIVVPVRSQWLEAWIRVEVCDDSARGFAFGNVMALIHDVD